MPEETIYATATATGKAAIAVLRLSGPATARALCRVAGALPGARRATLCRLRDPDSDETIDTGLVLWMPAPGSFTGEDCAELHCHGSPAVLRRLLEILSRLPGLRVANPGEFTLRAFLNGRMDLTAAEAVNDLILAETEAQRQQAVRQMAGGLARLYEDWRARLIRLGARLEAVLDFPDEGDVPEEDLEEVRAGAGALLAEMRAHLADGRRGEILRNGCRVAICGPPNSGKSSLANLVARREIAIVSSEAGSTRDIIETAVDLDGCLAIFSDSAGFEEATGAVGREGVRRARECALGADFRIILLTARDWEAEIACMAGILAAGPGVLALNKVDLGMPGRLPEAPLPVACLSVRTGQGVDGLLARVATFARGGEHSGRGDVLTAPRHRDAVVRACGFLEEALAQEIPELRAESIRLAIRETGRITGHVDAEDLLDVIFRDFCIGK